MTFRHLGFTARECVRALVAWLYWIAFLIGLLLVISLGNMLARA